MHFVGRMRVPATLCELMSDGRLAQLSDETVQLSIPQLNGVNLTFVRDIDSLKRWGEAVLRNESTDHESAFGMFKQSETEFRVELPSLNIEASLLFGEGRNIGDDTFIALYFHAGFACEPCVVLTCYDNVANQQGAVCDWRIVASTFSELADRLIGWNTSDSLGR